MALSRVLWVLPSLFCVATGQEGTSAGKECPPHKCLQNFYCGTVSKKCVTGNVRDTELQINALYARAQDVYARAKDADGKYRGYLNTIQKILEELRVNPYNADFSEDMQDGLREIRTVMSEGGLYPVAGGKCHAEQCEPGFHCGTVSQKCVTDDARDTEDQIRGIFRRAYVAKTRGGKNKDKNLRMYNIIAAIAMNLLDEAYTTKLLFPLTMKKGLVEMQKGLVTGVWAADAVCREKNLEKAKGFIEYKCQDPLVCSLITKKCVSEEINTMEDTIVKIFYAVRAAYRRLPEQFKVQFDEILVIMESVKTAKSTLPPFSENLASYLVKATEILGEVPASTECLDSIKPKHGAALETVMEAEGETEAEAEQKKLEMTFESEKAAAVTKQKEEDPGKQIDAEMEMSPTLMERIDELCKDGAVPGALIAEQLAAVSLIDADSLSDIDDDAVSLILRAVGYADTARGAGGVDGDETDSSIAEQLAAARSSSPRSSLRRIPQL